MNIILDRGFSGPVGVGNYYLMFSDKAGDGYDCTSYDTTVEVFQASSGNLHPSAETDFYYTPPIAENQWYNVVVTFNDTAYITYVNGVLKNIAYIATPGVAIGSSFDSISIGYDTHDAPAGFPYTFNGIIDDVKLYNGVLTDSQVVQINDTCGSITLQPVTANTTNEADNATFIENSSIAWASYQ